MITFEQIKSQTAFRNWLKQTYMLEDEDIDKLDRDVKNLFYKVWQKEKTRLLKEYGAIQ